LTVEPFFSQFAFVNHKKGTKSEMGEVIEDKDIQIVKYEHGSGPSSVEEEITPKKFEKSEAEKKYIRKLNSRLLPVAGLVIFIQAIISTLYITYQ
jgi:hypothetical protein